MHGPLADGRGSENEVERSRFSRFSFVERTRRFRLLRTSSAGNNVGIILINGRKVNHR